MELTYRMSQVHLLYDDIEQLQHILAIHEWSGDAIIRWGATVERQVLSAATLSQLIDEFGQSTLLEELHIHIEDGRKFVQIELNERQTGVRICGEEPFVLFLSLQLHQFFAARKIHRRSFIVPLIGSLALSASVMLQQQLSATSWFVFIVSFLALFLVTDVALPKQFMTLQREVARWRVVMRKAIRCINWLLLAIALVSYYKFS